MQIDVTQEDIDTGLPSKCFACPLSLAIARAIGDHDMVDVGYGGVSLWHGVTIGRPLALPYAAVKFMRSFDNGQFVQPFSFDLPLEGS